MDSLRPTATLIICTHNPREEYLSATLKALREQTLPLSKWELLLVDNRSTESVAPRFDLSWHPSGKHLREEKLGLSNARLCGLRAAGGEVIVFVDDDNLLDPDYLAKALDLAVKWPMLGAWGGHISARFERPAPPWLSDYAHHLAVRSCDTAVWASYVDDRNVPYGAGLCVRASVGQAYLRKADQDVLCAQLDRIGTALGSAGDHDICHTAQDLGLGIGRFPQLRMTHLIPAARMSPEYFLRLAYGNARSALLLALARNSAASYRRTPFWPVVKYVRGLTRPGMRGRIFRAQARGEIDALRSARRLPPATASS